MAAKRAEYFRNYIKAKKHERRQQLIEMLGGACVRCGTTETLQFDHIEPGTKSFSLGSNWTRAWHEMVAEAQKCQLLCKECHIVKTAEDLGPPKHGFPRYLYWGCRCGVCRAANAEHSAWWRAKKRAEQVSDDQAGGVTVSPR